MQDVVILATGIKVVNELPRVFEEISGDSFIRNIRSATDFNSITIEADPKDIQDLVYVLSTSPGALFLSLRHPSDHSLKGHLPTSSLNSLLGKAPKRKPSGQGRNKLPKLYK